MFHRTCALAVLLAGFLVSPAGAQQPIRFPADPVAPNPPQPVNPAAAQLLLKGQFYVIASPQPLLVLPTGAGGVTVSVRKGPLMIPAELAVGWAADPTDPEFVTFKDDYLYVVKAAKTGPVDLQVIPALNKVDDKGKQLPLKATDIVVKKINVDAGESPRPPPPPPPDPKPDPKPDTSPTKLYVVVVDETESAATALRGKLMFDPQIAARFQEKGHVWRFCDVNVVGADGKTPKDIERFVRAVGGKKLPQVFLVDADGKTRYSGDVPAKASDLLDVVKKVGG